MLQNNDLYSIYHFHICFHIKQTFLIMNHTYQETHSQVYVYSVCFIDETLNPNLFTVKRTVTPAKTLIPYSLCGWIMYLNVFMLCSHREIAKCQLQQFIGWNPLSVPLPSWALCLFKTKDAPQREYGLNEH